MNYHQATMKAKRENKKTLEDRPVLTALLDEGTRIRVEHLGLFLDESKGWFHDKYIVILGSDTFEYSSGIGHRYDEHTERYKRAPNLKPCKENIEWLNRWTKPLPVCVVDVVWALFMDAQTLEYCNDIHDFISDYGYEDTREAEKIWEGIKDNSVKFKKYFDINKLSEILEGY